MFKFLLGFFVALVLTATLGICRADAIEEVADDLYLCDYVGHITETKYGKIEGLVYFECFYTLDEVTTNSELKTLVVLNNKEMFVVGGWVK